MLWIIIGIYLTFSLSLAGWLTWSALTAAKHFKNKINNEGYRNEQISRLEF
jgi:hypothetical protein